ncbi:MAG: ABC transporter ATP-binding protein/permease [Clostridiales bacterium]|nr:ABC transporter ATP-binding protein/permease [Clostridiales bacterium]
MGKRRALKDDLQMILRGIHEFDAILPGQMKLVALRSVILSLSPSIAMVASARVINELAGEMRLSFLLAYVLTAIGLALGLAMLSGRLKAKIDVGYSQLFSSHDIVLNEKAHNLPYANLEDVRIRELSDQVSGSIHVSGAGMASLYWDLEILVKSFCSATIAVALCADVFRGGATQSFTGIFAFVNSPWAILLLAALAVPSALLSSRLTSKMFDVSFDVFKDGAKYNRYANFYMHDYLSDDKSAKDVRIYAQEDLIVRETQNRCYVPFCEGDKREKKASNKYNGVKLLLSALAGGAVYLLIGLKALSGTVGAGMVVMAYGAVTMFIHAVSDLSMIFTDLRNNNEHLKLYFEYIDLPSQKDLGELTPDLSKTPEIRFSNVSFHYPWSEEYALKDVSLVLPTGKKLAIVGMNGSGKTTLIKLLCGLYETTKGSVTLNSEPIASYKREKYMALFSVVFQDFRLLSFSIAQNVAASTTYDKNRVEECLKAAGLGSKYGVETALYHDYEENGISLSGGEEQKLAIARAIYKDAPIVILDEPTAALDPLSEYEIYTKFNEIVGDKTTVFISHRLSSCRFCDVIAVIHEGRIAQWGTHDELVNVPGKYSDLWNAQAQHYTTVEA